MVDGLVGKCFLVKYSTLSGVLSDSGFLLFENLLCVYINDRKEIKCLLLAK